MKISAKAINTLITMEPKQIGLGNLLEAPLLNLITRDEGTVFRQVWGVPRDSTSSLLVGRGQSTSSTNAPLI